MAACGNGKMRFQQILTAWRLIWRLTKRYVQNFWTPTFELTPPPTLTPLGIWLSYVKFAAPCYNVTFHIGKMWCKPLETWDKSWKLHQNAYWASCSMLTAKENLRQIFRLQRLLKICGITANDFCAPHLPQGPQMTYLGCSNWKLHIWTLATLCYRFCQYVTLGAIHWILWNYLYFFSGCLY